MYQTAIYQLPAPDQLPPDVGPDVPADIKALADAIDSKLTPYSQGNGDPATLGIAPGKAGRRHEDLLTGDEYLDIGSAWVLKTPAANPAANVAGLRTLGNGALEATAGNDPRLSDARAPLDGSVDATKIANALKPSAGAAAAAEALRALGVVAGTAAAGNDARLTDQRVPTDASVTWAKLAAALIGAGANQVPAGNDARFTDQRVPTDGSVTTTKMATAALNAFLKLFTSGDHKVKWGNTNIDGAGFGSQITGSRSIAHGMGAVPVWAIVWCTTGTSTGDASDPIICSLVSLDVTNINIRIRTASGGTINFPGIGAWWLAIS